MCIFYDQSIFCVGKCESMLISLLWLYAFTFRFTIHFSIFLNMLGFVCVMVCVCVLVCIHYMCDCLQKKMPDRQQVPAAEREPCLMILKKL